MPKISNLPDQDHVMRYVSWGKLRRDEDDKVLGFLPQAFQLRPDEPSLSVNWVEYFGDPDTRERDSVWALRRTRNAGTKSAFGIANVGKIKDICLSRNVRVRVVHEPRETEPAHASIRRLPVDDLILLAVLAEEAFTRLIRNADIPKQPID